MQDLLSPPLHCCWSLYVCPLFFLFVFVFFFIECKSYLDRSLHRQYIQVYNVSTDMNPKYWHIRAQRDNRVFLIHIHQHLHRMKKIKAKNSPGWDTSSNSMEVALCICVLFFLLLFLPVLFTYFKPRFFCLFSWLFSVMLHEQFFGNYSCLTLL